MVILIARLCTLYTCIWSHKQVQNGCIDTLGRCTATLDDGFRVPAIGRSQVIRSLAGFVDFFQCCCLGLKVSWIVKLASPRCIFQMDELHYERATWGSCTEIIKHTASLCGQRNIWLVFIQMAQHVCQGLPDTSLWCILLVHLSKHASRKDTWRVSIAAGILLPLPSSPSSGVRAATVSQLIWSQALVCVFGRDHQVRWWRYWTSFHSGVHLCLKNYFDSIFSLASLLIWVLCFPECVWRIFGWICLQITSSVCLCLKTSCQIFICITNWPSFCCLLCCCYFPCLLILFLTHRRFFPFQICSFFKWWNSTWSATILG